MVCMANEKKMEGSGISTGGFLRKVDREQGYKKAAEFFLLLGKNQAAKVLAQLSEDEIVGIIGEIARLRNIDPMEAKKIAAEFGLPELKRPGSSGQAIASGGLESAREILTAAFGDERSRHFIDRVEQQQASDYFEFLKEIDPGRITSLIHDESPQVVSLVLAYLDPASASDVLQSLPGETQREAAKRIAQMGKVLPEVVRRTADELKKKLFQQSDFSSQKIDGKSALREILKNMDFGQEQAILETLSAEKPELADELEKELFTMEIFRRLRARELQLFLREITDRDFAMALKGESDELKEFLLASVSTRRKALILEESELAGEVPRKEADKIRQVVLGALKTQIRSGAIKLTEKNDKLIH